MRAVCPRCGCACREVPPLPALHDTLEAPPMVVANQELEPWPEEADTAVQVPHALVPRELRGAS